MKDVKGEKTYFQAEKDQGQQCPRNVGWFESCSVSDFPMSVTRDLSVMRGFATLEARPLIQNLKPMFEVYNNATGRI